MTTDVTPAFAAATADGDERPRATPRDAFTRAREIVHRGERLDMLSLAAELGIGRATLYRWTGDRERLLADIMWVDVKGLLEQTFEPPGGGVAAVHAMALRFLDLLTTGDRLTTLLRSQGEVAFRLITDPHGGVRPRLVAAIAERIRMEADSGHYRPPEEPDLLAEGMVTLGERFLYHGGDPAANPDADRASRIIALLIRERS